MVLALTGCGVMCDRCPHFEKKCPGCAAVQGAPWWALEHLPTKVCPIYDCSVNKKHLDTCGACAQLPCKTFTDLRDPDMTDAEYQEQLATRLQRLRGNAPRPSRQG